VRFLNKKLSVLSCSNAEDTVLKYLSSVTDGENYALIPKNMTLLSKMLGIGRATLYRTLDNLETSGRILRENNKIKVINNEKIY
jgi:predicted transcriptional regulator